MSRRYPLEPLAEAMCLSMNQACLKLGVSGTTQKEYRARGVTELVADRLAVRAGLHPCEVWPDFGLQPCEECGELFAATRPGHRFCGASCRDRRSARQRYASRPETREAVLARRRRYYAENAAYERARERRRYHEIHNLPTSK